MRCLRPRPFPASSSALFSCRYLLSPPFQRVLLIFPQKDLVRGQAHHEVTAQRHGLLRQGTVPLAGPEPGMLFSPPSMLGPHLPSKGGGGSISGSSCSFPQHLLHPLCKGNPRQVLDWIKNALTELCDKENLQRAAHFRAPSRV